MTRLDGLSKKDHEWMVEKLAFAAVDTFSRAHDDASVEWHKPDTRTGDDIPRYCQEFYGTCFDRGHIGETAYNTNGWCPGQIALLKQLWTINEASYSMISSYTTACKEWIDNGWAPSPEDGRRAWVAKQAKQSIGHTEGPFAKLPVCEPDREYDSDEVEALDEEQEEEGEEEEEEEEEEIKQESEEEGAEEESVSEDSEEDDDRVPSADTDDEEDENEDEQRKKKKKTDA